MSAGRIDLTEKLHNYIQAFHKIQDSKNQSSFLKEKFPRTELWRFFVEIPRQSEGKALLTELFQVLNQEEKKLVPDLLEKPIAFHLKNIETLPKEEKSLEGLLADVAVDAMNFLRAEEDEQRKNIFLKSSLNNGLLHLTGWLSFEVTEPGCVKAFIDELLKLEDKSRDKKKEEDLESFISRNISLIKSFHANVSKNVKGLYSTDLGEFRSIPATKYPVNVGVNFSEAGVNDILFSMALITQRFPEFKAYFQNYKSEENYYVSRITPTEDKTISQIIKEIVQYVLTQYYFKMEQSTSSIQKLENIVLLIRTLEQVHPFGDANCRSICLLYFNHLLLENGFPLAILEDPNKFDGHTVEELINDTIMGMETLLAVTNGKMDVGGITTEQIVKDLRGEDLALAYQLGFAVKKPENILDEKDYRAAVLHLKKYIENNDWKQEKENSIEIEFDGESEKVKKKIPIKIYKQWEIIDNFLKTSSSQSSWKNIYEKVLSMHNNQDEVKSQHKLFDNHSSNVEIDEYFKKLSVSQPNELSTIFPVISITRNKNFD